MLRPALLLTLALAGPLLLATSPVVTQMLPRGAQRGTEVEVRLKGQRLDQPLGLFLFRPGIEVLEILPGDATGLRVRLRIAPDCPLGVHPVRLRTASGISNLRTFHVGTLPERPESEPNDNLATAQPLTPDVTVNGTLRNGDVDVFAVDLPAGAEISFEVEAVRLGDTLIDPRLRLFDPRGDVIATAEDATLTLMDPVLTRRLPEGGRYFVELADTALGGSDSAAYRFHVGFFPRPLGAVPAGGRPGEVVGLRGLGPGSAWAGTATIPDRSGPVFDFFPSDGRGTSPTPIRLAPAPFPSVGATGPSSGPSPEPVDAPVALNGVLAAAGAEHLWAVRLAKAQEYEIASVSRALRSPVDSVIQVRATDGKVLAENDDAGGPDSRLSFRPPADGLYGVAVFDHLHRGGAEFFYRVHVAPPLRTISTRVLTPRREDLTTAAVPRGGRAGVVLQVDGPAGEKPWTLGFPGLPAAVTAQADVLRPRGPPQVPVVFAAPEDAPLEGHLASVTVAQDGAGSIEDAGFRQRIPLLRVDNDDPYLVCEVQRLPVAVVAQLPFSVELEPPGGPLVRGGAIDLRVTVRRDAAFATPIQLKMLWTPPGVSASEVRAAPGQSEVTLPLTGAGGAPDGRWAIAVVATADAGGDASTCTALVSLEVAGPFITAEVGKAWAEQGQTVALPVTFKKQRPFDGRFRPEIVNLPRGVVFEPPELTAEAEDVTLQLQIAPDAVVGRFKDVVLRFAVPTAAGPVIHQFRGGEIRIDQPAPKADGAPAGAKRAWGTVENPKT